MATKAGPYEPTFTVDQVLQRANEMDRRRRHQVDVQREVINRLLQRQGHTLTDEVKELTEELARARATIERVTDYATGLKHSAVAREVVKLVGDDA